MNVPDDRRYTEDHEWAMTVDGDRVRIGITDYAQDALGDVVYVELPEVGKTVTRGETLAEVESTKSVADVYAPVGGTVASVNEALGEHPELVNSSPYEEGWFLELSEAASADLSELLDAAAYRALTED